jgi:hypothetical protein
MDNKGATSALAVAAMLAATPSVFDTNRPAKGPSKGSGSGCTAKCKGCGVTGAVSSGKGGKRHIEGCNC